MRGGVACDSKVVVREKAPPPPPPPSPLSCLMPPRPPVVVRVGGVLEPVRDKVLGLVHVVSGGVRATCRRAGLLARRVQGKFEKNSDDGEGGI